MFIMMIVKPLHQYLASIAQWLEHWSCKPGVVSSILTGGLHFSFSLCITLVGNTLKTMIIRIFRTPVVVYASIAQWIEHWSRKPGVVSSILTGGSAFGVTL